EAFYDPQRPTPGKMYTRAGAFVDGVEEFDPLFFGISPREATHMDPHHRLLLEMSWEALERAGLAPSSLVDSQTGVFVGIGESDYPLVLQGASGGGTDPYAVTNSGHSIAAGRLAYTLGLQGPTLAVDTACSSSLVAVHLACQSLRNGECDLALAGGVNLMLTPFSHIALSQMQALSPDGRCKTFDAAADGYGRGEGGAVVLLKRLGDAQRDGDAVLAVVKGSAVNHDGHSSGLTVPNKRAQEKLLRQALATAQVTPEQVSYIEAHGTGTALGDPIEIRALGAVFGAVRERPLWVGSVKTNIGHLEFAAGVAGLMKLVMVLRQGLIPPHLHLRTPNPHIEWGALPVRVPAAVEAWPAGVPRIGGVSSFGFSGTNAHVVVEGAAVQPGHPEAEQPAERLQQLFTLSARDDAALAAYIRSYVDFLSGHPELDLGDLSYTSHLGRSHFSHRLSVVAGSVVEMREKLVAASRGEQETGRGVVTAQQETPQVAFLFTGQGAQYSGMGRELYETQPLFRESIDRCAALLAGQLESPLLEVLGYTGEAQSIDRTENTQPALFVLEYALAQLWRSWGVEPEILLGHSVGELAAACVAGVFSLEDGLTLVAARGRLMGALPQEGEMLSLQAPESRVREAIAPYEDEVSIAAINGPASVVISGRRAAVLAVGESLAAEG
ncbi:MAG: type I polyketide synthase, partial [Caldilinea sp.]